MYLFAHTRLEILFTFAEGAGANQNGRESGRGQIGLPERQLHSALHHPRLYIRSLGFVGASPAHPSFLLVAENYSGLLRHPPARSLVVPGFSRVDVTVIEFR